MTSKMDKRGRAATRAGLALTAPLGGASSDQASEARAEHGIAGSVREPKFPKFGSEFQLLSITYMCAWQMRFRNLATESGV